MPGWEFACGIYGTPAALVPQSIPVCWAAAAPSLCAAHEGQMQPEMAALLAHSQLVLGDQPTPLLLPSVSQGCPLPGLFMLPGTADPGCWVSQIPCSAKVALPPEFSVLSLIPSFPSQQMLRVNQRCR